MAAGILTVEPVIKTRAEQKLEWLYQQQKHRRLTNEEWQRDAWAPLPEAAQPARYQCQRCAPDGLALSGALGTEAWIAQAWGADDKE